MVDSIRSALKAGALPENGRDLLRPLLETSRKFISQEGAVWDFKRQWPASHSDSYFGGVARLICAFANTEGGIVVFGVHDEARTSGHNKVPPNMDRLLQALGQLLTEVPELHLKHYSEDEAFDVAVLMVRPIEPTTMPIRFVKRIEGYNANVIWVRQGHQVLHAEPHHVATLYCRSSNEQTTNDEFLSGALPPSPATIKRFVGRLNTIDQIFRWLKLSDEPRTFIYGKGGSGKTTIAYEIARVLRFDGSRIRISGEPLDNVIFVTAKEQTLQVMTQRTSPFQGRDFSDERELYAAILTLGNWTSEPVYDLSLDRLKKEIKSFFDVTSNFIVIDDIDTLTTKGLEAGFDFLYGVLWRSKRKTKILYTGRNAPTHSLANSIEVPGLESGDYEDFVEVCAKQFRVGPPDADLVAGQLSKVSERRPLVIESIIALRRTAGSYDRAIKLFEDDSGEDVRKYVFQREWDALAQNSRGMYLLAVLAIHSDPLTFDDLTALLRYKDGDVNDALAQVREMFLQVNEVGDQTSYQLGALTRAFVIERSKKLDKYAALEARVKSYKKNFYPENPALSRLRDRVEGLVYQAQRSSKQDSLRQALYLVTNGGVTPKVSEDPRFLSLQGFAYISQSPPMFEDARRSFSHVFSMKFEPEIEHLRKWFLVEKNSGYGSDECLKIAEFVCRGKRYSDDEKLEFLSKKATQLFHRGKNNVYYAPDEGIADISSALDFHLSCYMSNREHGYSQLDTFAKAAQECSFFLFNFLISNKRFDDFFRIVNKIAQTSAVKLDALEAPLVRALELCELARGTKTELQKLIGRMDHLRREVSSRHRWYDSAGGERINSLATRMTGSLSRQLA